MTTGAPRKAVQLSRAELAEIERARTSGLVEAVAGTGAGRSEAAALRALVVLGLERVREHAAHAGYAALAASQDEADHAFHAAVRGRRQAAER
jgi:hypothetical protein